jgi:plasmid stabilization system protein ParE
MYKIKILKTAKDDLQDISNYISLDNPLQAKIIIEKIYLSITYLQSFPYL